jgi:hypothetical protein
MFEFLEATTLEPGAQSAYAGLRKRYPIATLAFGWFFFFTVFFEGL